MKRVVWFTMGAAAGVAGTTWTQRKVKQAAAAAKPRAVATRAAGAVRSRGADFVDALREGRLAMHQREAELRARARRSRGDHRGGRGAVDTDPPYPPRRESPHPEAVTRRD